MSTLAFTHPELVRVANLSSTDLERIQQCRHPHTRLGFAYQLAFVRLANRLPVQEPLEMVKEILTYVGVQLNISPSVIQGYAEQRRTISNHQQEICDYLQIRHFGESEVALLETFLFEEACRLEQTGPLLVRAKSFLQENDILFPADSTLHRLIAGQRQQAREYIFRRVMDRLPADLAEKLDALLVAGDRRLTPFQALKQPPGKPSPAAILRLRTSSVWIFPGSTTTTSGRWLAMPAAVRRTGCVACRTNIAMWCWPASYGRSTATPSTTWWTRTTSS